MLINNMAGTNSWFYDTQMSSKLQRTGFVIWLLKEEVKIKQNHFSSRWWFSGLHFFYLPTSNLWCWLLHECCLHYANGLRHKHVSTSSLDSISFPSKNGEVLEQGLWCTFIGTGHIWVHQEFSNLIVWVHRQLNTAI